MLRHEAKAMRAKTMVALLAAALTFGAWQGVAHGSA